MPTFRSTLFHLHRQVGINLPAREDGTECSETSVYKIQTPGNYPEENMQHTEHGESLKSRSFVLFCLFVCLFVCPVIGIFVGILHFF